MNRQFMISVFATVVAGQGAVLAAAGEGKLDELILEFPVSETVFPQEKGELQITAGGGVLERGVAKAGRRSHGS